MSSDDIAQQILARIQAQTTEAQERPAQVERWRDEVLVTTGRGTAAAGRVVAEVDLQGVLTGLAVSDIVAARGGRVAGPAVLAAITAAHEDVKAKVGASSARMWGADTPTTNALAAEVRADNPSLHPSDDTPPAARPRTEGTW
ncbi:hypothetical protein ACOCJ5_14880 [Knoellia sp. CPCC 206450]|uniref:hypothetical protein n=1 Tax=Knoellia tibetensis TaxID=3404798 RepID=UPI003B43AA04